MAAEHPPEVVALVRAARAIREEAAWVCDISTCNCSARRKVVALDAVLAPFGEISDAQ